MDRTFSIRRLLPKNEKRRICRSDIGFPFVASVGGRENGFFLPLSGSEAVKMDFFFRRVTRGSKNEFSLAMLYTYHKGL